VRPYSVGQTVNGTLRPSNCILQPHYTDYYEMIISRQRSVTLTMRSTEVDAYLRVMDAAGAVVVFDDDSGGGLDAQLTHGFPAGTYVIHAKAVSGGSYTLSSN
jgi:hypothetical protein